MTARGSWFGTLAIGAVFGPALFTVAWIVLGLLRPGYSPVSQPISVLAVGENGRIMGDTLIVADLLCIIGIFGIFGGFSRELGIFARWTCTILMLLAPFGALWSGVFTLDASGMHSFGAQLAYGAPTFALPVTGFVLRRFPSWRRFATWMIVGGLMTLAALDALILLSPVIQTSTAGLWQRVLCTEILAWYAAMGWKASRLVG